MRTFVSALVLLALAVPVNAEHCTTYSTSRPEVDAAGYYVDDDNFVFCYATSATLLRNNICSIWVYEETNGIPGLQRADEVVDDTCHGMIEGDRIVV